MKTLSEFTVDYDEMDFHYYLVHRACESIEQPVNTELPASSANLVDIIKMAKEHMREYHGVDLDKFDPQDCPRASEHIFLEHCDNCGYES